MLRLALTLCLCLAACRSTTEPPAEFARALHRAPRGYIARQGASVVECAVAIERHALPRAADVTIDAVQPGGVEVTFEQVFRADAVLYRARTRYQAPGPPSRTVLVDAAGRVIERAYEVTDDEVAASADLDAAERALRAAFAGLNVRFEIVHGSPGTEWVRGHADAAPDARVGDCDRDGTLHCVADLEWLDGGTATEPRPTPVR